MVRGIGTHYQRFERGIFRLYPNAGKPKTNIPADFVPVAVRPHQRIALDISVVNKTLVDLNLLPAGHSVSKRHLKIIAIVAAELGISTINCVENLQRVARQIESARRRVNEAALDQILCAKTPTLDKLGSINAAERRWLDYAGSKLTPLVTAMLDKQNFFDEENGLQAFVQAQGHAASILHTQRVRDGNIPMLRPAYLPEGIKNPQRFASSISYFPDRPVFNTLWPADLSKEEFDFICKTYPPDHSILLPHTVVERLEAGKVHQIRKSREGKEWIVEGKDGIKYLATNICFHPRFQNEFVQLAQHLRMSAAIRVGDESLHPSFTKYLLAVAKAIEKGDFDQWLKADCEQTEGNLFFTLFPHEGYWDDNLKFPIQGELGIRDQGLLNAFASNLEAVNELERYACAIAQEYGLSVEPRVFLPEDIGFMAQFVWLYKNMGFLRAFPFGEVAGHDYPKKPECYPASTKYHRNVVLLDSIVARLNVHYEELIKIFFTPEEARLIDEAAAVRFVLWHEASHGIVGNRDSTVMKDGRSMGKTYGSLWGAIAEPGGDFGSAFVTLFILLKKGKITRDEALGSIYFNLIRSLEKIAPKEMALKDSFLADPHRTGIMLMFGYLFKSNLTILQTGNDNRLQIDMESLEKLVEPFLRKLIYFGLAGSPEEFKQFYRECVSAIPDEFTHKIIEIIGKRARTFLVERPGDVINQLG